MLKKLVRQMLTAQILSALTVSLCLLIDNMMIGRFLGEGAMAAYGLANPILLVIGALGSMLSAGVQVVCSRSLGKGSQEETNRGYSSAIAVAAVVSLVLTALVLVFRSPIARLMGASGDPTLFKDTKDYLAGFIIGAPGTMGALILVPFMQMAGRSGLLIAAVLGMTVADIVLDLLNVLIFHGGMFGMGLASSLSYYVALVIGCFYFLSKKSVFRFSTKLVSRQKIRELMVGGVPTVFNMASSVVLVFIMNRILMWTGGSAAVAAYSVISTIGNASNCISTGMGGVSLTLSGIFYNEEDRTGLRELLPILLKDALILGVCVCALLLVFAPVCVGLFLPNASESQTMAIFGVRAFALGLIPCCMLNAMKSGYQGVERVHMTEAISVLECAVVPALFAYLAGSIFGTRGVWFYFIAGEALVLLWIFLFAWKKAGRVSMRADELLMLPKDFGVAPENLMEVNIRTMDDVVKSSQDAQTFCLAHGQSARTSTHLALCVEEMAGNVVSHGFKADGKNTLSVRIQHKNDKWFLRFRDDCTAFDPVSYVPVATEPERGIGIKMVLKMAQEVRYTYSLNLNNLTVIL